MWNGRPTRCRQRPLQRELSYHYRRLTLSVFSDTGLEPPLQEFHNMTRPIEQVPNTSGLKHSIELRGIPKHVCYAMTSLITKGPLRRFNPRDRAPNNRYDSKQNYLADRLSNVDDYRQLFSPFCSFKDKVVLELGCSSGYLLNAFLELEKFTAIGADISAEALAKARTRFPEGIRYIQTTSTSIPLPDNSVDITYTIDTVEHLSRPLEIFQEVY